MWRDLDGNIGHSQTDPVNLINTSETQAPLYSERHNDIEDTRDSRLGLSMRTSKTIFLFSFVSQLNIVASSALHRPAACAELTRITDINANPHLTIATFIIFRALHQRHQSSA
jgi:hypothetical protein